MAQIIKHRRGSLESISGATKRAGELLVVTGSSGITAANGDSILFVGIDGSTATPSNKVLQGTEVPNLTGASYDTSVDGIPFYDTSAQKLYILNKGGNVEVRATANTGGTGIVSSSAQIDTLGFLQVDGDSVVSGSSQVTISSTTGFSDFSSSLKSTDDAQKARLSSLESFSASADLDISELFSTASDHETRVDALESFSSSLEGGFVNNAELAAATGALEDADSAQQARLSSLEGFSGSQETKNSTLSTYTASVDSRLNQLSTDSGSQAGRLSSIEGFTSSIDTTIKTKLDADAVVSSSAQIVTLLSNQATDFGTGRVSADDFGNADGTSTFTGSFVGDGSGLTGLVSSLGIAGDSGTDTVDLLTDTLTFAGTANEIEIAVTNNQVQVGIVENPTLTGNVTITGDLQVQGTTTTVDSTTISLGDNIIQLNGTGAAYGGLIIVDTTAPNQVSGSLLWDATNDYWIAGASGSESKVLLANGDSVISGSSQVNADSITNFDANVKDKLNADSVISGSSQVNADSITNFDENVKAKLDADGVISGSSQVQIDSVTGFTSFSSSVDSRVDVLEAAVGEGSNLDLRIDALEAFSSSLDDSFVTEAELASATGALEDADSAQQARLTSLEGFSGSQESKDSTLAIYTASVDSRLNQLSTDSGSQAGRLDNLESFTSSIDTTIKTKLNVEAVVSSSAQVVAHLVDQATDFGTGRVSADNFGDAAGTSTFTGSFVGDGSSLTGLVTDLRISGSTGNDVVSLLTDDLTFAGGTAISVAVTDNTITVNASDASTSAKGIASFASTNFSVTSGDVSIKSGGVPAAALAADVAGTGISLNGVDNSIEVDYGSSAGTAVEGNTSLTVQGTANEISISGGSVTLGAGGTVTIGLPDSVTIATASIQNDLSVGGNVEITGNLSVLGTTTTIDSTTVQIGDNIIELNIGGAQSTAGIQVTDATGGNTVSGSLLWDGTNDYWKAGALGSEKELARLNADPTSNTVLKADANGLLVDSLITDDGTNVTISGNAELRINGATANSFVYFDSNKSLEAVTPSNAGDVIQWNGSSFVASNELDGGTF